MAKILILNDEPDLLEISSLVLQDFGHDVLTLANGHRILDTARSFDPDLILLDWVMPGLTGDQAFRLLTNGLESKRPIVMMSALEDGRERSRKLGAAGFLPKPFDANQLHETVKRVLNGSPGSRPDHH